MTTSRQLYGRMPDRDLAALLGVHPTTVAYRRKQLGIPAFHAKSTVFRPSVAEGLYCLGVFPIDTDERCPVPQCGCPAVRAAGFLVRGQVLVLTTCDAHAETIVEWCSQWRHNVVAGVVAALGRPTYQMRGRMCVSQARSARRPS